MIRMVLNGLTRLCGTEGANQAQHIQGLEKAGFAAGVPAFKDVETDGGCE